MELPLCPFCKQKPLLQNHNIYVKCPTEKCPLHPVDFLFSEWLQLDATPPQPYPNALNQSVREKVLRECLDIVTQCSVREPSPSADKNVFVVPTRLLLQEIEKAIHR